MGGDEGLHDLIDDLVGIGFDLVYCSVTTEAGIASKVWPIGRRPITCMRQCV